MALFEGAGVIELQKNLLKIGHNISPIVRCHAPFQILSEGQSKGP